MNDLIVENCIRVEQNGLPLYIFTLTSGEIYNNFAISRRYNNKEDGYQRIVKETKIKKIISYLKGVNQNSYPSILPNSILIALDSIEYINNTLIIKDSEKGIKGLIIDGQHRLKGAYDYDINFPLVIIGVANLEPKYQARLFITINKTQTPLPSSLYLDLISATSDEDIRANLDSEVITAEQKTIELIKDLNRDENSSLKGLIAETGEEKGKINLALMVKLIKPYLNYTDGKFKGHSYNDQLKIFINYFNALKVVFEDEWNKQKVLKSPILGGLIKSLEGVFDVVYMTHKNFKENSVIYILANIQDILLSELANKVGGGTLTESSFSKKFIQTLKNRVKNDENYRVEL